MNMPEEIDDVVHSAVHLDWWYVTIHSPSEGVILKRTVDCLNWQILQTPAAVMSCQGLASHRGQLYALFDLSGSSNRSTIYQFMEPGNSGNAEPTWARLQNGTLPHQQWYPAMFGIGESLVIAGGRTGAGNTHRVSEYCLKTHRWQEACKKRGTQHSQDRSSWPRLPRPLSGLQAVFVKDYLYLVGGGSGVSVPNTRVFRIKTKSGRPCGEWEVDSIPENPTQSGYYGACTVASHLVIAGGQRKFDGAVQPGVFVLDSAGPEWLPLASLSTARARPSLTFFNGKLFSLCGRVNKPKEAGGWCRFTEELVIRVNG